MHSYFGGNPMFIEVPSRVGELLLAVHLRRTAGDPRTIRWAQLLLVDSFVSSLSVTGVQAYLERQLFELAWSGKPVTLSEISAGYREGLSALLGDGVELGALGSVLWAAWPHVFSPTYSVSYPAGMAGAASVVARITSGQDGAADDYVAALRAGSSQNPIELFKLTGTDLGGGSPMQPFAALFGALVSELEAAWSA